MKKITALSWNVNGLRAVHKKGALEPILALGADILCLQETKASPDQLPDELRELDGHSSYFSSAEKKGYSGVAIYSRIKPLKVSYGFGIERFDNEGRILVADYGDFTLLNIYFPNGKQSEDRLRYKMDFYDAFLDYVENLKAQGKNIVVCGDVNTAHHEIDLAHPKENEKVSGFLPEERAWMDKFIATGYVDTFRVFNREPEQYTWWAAWGKARERNIGWRIDYFYVNQAFQSEVLDAYILPDIMGSDHCPIGIELQVPD